jgi:UDP-N-acetylglucosamine transferase subunit ALG13
MRITVLVGTDHHDFSRLVRWADDWQRDHLDDEVLVQHGFSPAPSLARGLELVPPTELVELLRTADVVVTHGGPGTIMSARHAGHHPIAVPRDPGLGEHVDEHQMRFVTWAAAKGLCDEAVSVEELSQTVSALGTSGTRAESHVALAPAVDQELLDRAAGSRRRRRDPSPGAVPVLYCPGPTWRPMAPPHDLQSTPVLVLGQVSRLWLGGADAPCSCGADRGECPFWSDVTERAFADCGPQTLERAGALHRDLARRRLAAARRHPGGDARRAYLELALTYLRVCTAALAAADAGAVVDHGGPLADVLPLSHCRELDIRVLHESGHQAAAGRPDRLTPAALRYRGVPTWRPSMAGAAVEPAAGHQLIPANAAALHGSITW